MVSSGASIVSMRFNIDFFRKIAWGVLKCSIKSIFDVFHVVILWLEEIK